MLVNLPVGCTFLFQLLYFEQWVSKEEILEKAQEYSGLFHKEWKWRYKEPLSSQK